MKRLALGGLVMMLFVTTDEFARGIELDQSSSLPTIQQPGMQADGTFRFLLFGRPGDRTTIQTSEDLVNWASFGCFVITNIPMEIIDPAARNFGARFYRAVSDNTPAGSTVTAERGIAPGTQIATAGQQVPSSSAQIRREAVSHLAPVDSANPFYLPGLRGPAALSRKQAIIERLNRIKIEDFTATKSRLDDLLIVLSNEARRADPARHGINFIIDRSAAAAMASSAPKLIDPATGLPMAADPGEITITAGPLRNASVRMILDELVKAAQPRINYSINDYAVVLSLKDSSPEPLFTKRIKVDSSTFLSNRETLAAAMRRFFIMAGADLTPPKAVFFNDREGLLLVHATQADIDLIEAACRF